jgi:hypothetical protein
MPSHHTVDPHNKQRGKRTVGSDPTSCVTPAVSPTALLRIFRNTQEDAASSEYWQVRQANCSRWVSGSSLGYSMFELQDTLSARDQVVKGWKLIPFAAEAEGDLFHILLLLITCAGRWGSHGDSGRGVAGLRDETETVNLMLLVGLECFWNCVEIVFGMMA